MKLSKITHKQQEILILLYKYRFLNRIQIQQLMKHKDKKTINTWLKDLNEKQYVKRIYSTHFLEKTKPAIYYLGINGIRQLKTTHEYPIEELRKRYREHERSQGFIDRSILVAQCRCRLAMSTKQSQTATYYCCTQADYVDPSHVYHFLAEDDTVHPNFCIMKLEQSKQPKQKVQGGRSVEEPEPIRTNYLLEIFDATLPRYRVKKRIKDYVQYLIDDEWDSGDNNPPPIILLVMPTLVDLIYAKRRTKKLLLDEYYETEDIPDDLHIRFTTIEQLKQHGITANIWEEQRALYGV